MKKYINGRSLFISVLLGIFLGIGFIFFFVPIRNASSQFWLSSLYLLRSFYWWEQIEAYIHFICNFHDQREY